MPTITEPTGPDLLFDTSGDDTILGLRGADTISVSGGVDSVDGGSYELNTLHVDYSGKIEDFVGYFPGYGGYRGQISSGDAAAGPDALVYTNIAYPDVRFGSGDDAAYVRGSYVQVTLDGGAGDDTLHADFSDYDSGYGLKASGLVLQLDPSGASHPFGSGDTAVAGFEHLDVLTGYGPDLIIGGALSDTLAGNAGHNTLYGGGGDDSLISAGGADLDLRRRRRRYVAHRPLLRRHLRHQRADRRLRRRRIRLALAGIRPDHLFVHRDPRRAAGREGRRVHRHRRAASRAYRRWGWKRHAELVGDLGRRDSGGRCGVGPYLRRRRAAPGLWRRRQRHADGRGVVRHALWRDGRGRDDRRRRERHLFHRRSWRPGGRAGRWRHGRHGSHHALDLRDAEQRGDPALRRRRRFRGLRRAGLGRVRRLGLVPRCCTGWRARPYTGVREPTSSMPARERRRCTAATGTMSSASPPARRRRSAAALGSTSWSTPPGPRRT